MQHCPVVKFHAECFTISAVANEQDLWRFVADRLGRQPVTLLIVAESSGSSPGRAGYKMAVAANGELFGSIGGGVMEVALVEQAKTEAGNRTAKSVLREQVHRRNVPNASGMICSGRQAVIVTRLTSDDLQTVERILDPLTRYEQTAVEISNSRFAIGKSAAGRPPTSFSKIGESEFVYRERVGHMAELFIIGGGHCALALSEVMSKLAFRISIFDDRPTLNTLEKNQFADEIAIIDTYHKIASLIPQGESTYVVIMTLGYASDAVVIRQLIDHDVKYLGVLGSKAKMMTLMKELEAEGVSAEKLARIYTPIGIPINSRTPEEIAVSIAAQIISIKNAD